MKKYRIFFIFLILVALGFYLNRAYARIYYIIGQADLKAPPHQPVYVSGGLTAKPEINYLALGDSLTAGVGANKYEQSYPYLISQWLAAAGYKVSLKSEAFPGAKAGDLVNQLIKVPVKEQPNLITIFIGVNDVHGNVSQAEFSKNYEWILNHLLPETKADIYLIGLPYIGSPSLIWFPYNYYFAWRTKQFNAAIKKLAVQYGLNYVDLYTPTVSLFKQDGTHYAPDFFHPSTSGYALWAQVIYAALRK